MTGRAGDVRTGDVRTYDGARGPAADRGPQKPEIPGTETFRIELAELLPAGEVITNPDSMERYSHDEAEWAPYGTPLAVVRPADSAQVQAVVRWCIEHRVPVIPRGAGTGLSGGANAVDGAVIVSFEKMNAILRIDPVERLAVVQPGVINDTCGRPVPSRSVVSAGPGQCTVVHHRRQRRHECGRCLLCEVRRHQGLRARPRGGHRHR